MARIPDEELERIKREVLVERLVEAAGVQLTPHGKDLIGLCPFHDDREPSLVITPSKNLWHCLGACGEGGSVIDWVMKSEDVSFRHAVELLRDKLATAGPATEPTHRKLPRLTCADDQALLNQVLDYYTERLKQSPEALEYLKSRGLTHPELIDTFCLGYADRTLGYRLPRKGSSNDVRERLQTMGIIRKSGHEHFSGSLVIPVRDGNGQVTEVYGRKIRKDLRKGTPLHLYLPGPHRGVWNSEALGAYSEIILCESLIDALTFWSAGYRNVTASYGTEGFCKDHLEAFKEHGVEKVLIAYDRDEAGDKAAETLAEKLMAEGMECFRVLFPRGMDANAYALQVGPPEKSLGLVLRKALWMGKAAIGATKEGKDAPSPLAATPEPPAPSPGIDAEVGDEQVVIRFGDRRYRVRGLEKNTAYGQLKVNVLASKDAAFHVDTLDLYSARPRGVFVKQAAKELSVEEDVVKRDLGKVLLKLEELVDQQIKEAMAPKEKPVVITEEDKAAALELLRDPKLLERILQGFEACGVVGEQTNKLVGYLACVSRKLEEPLAVIIQSSSAAGKSSLMEAILALMPSEDRVKYSAMTGQSLFYLGETDLAHKILAIVEEEGAEQASYALKLLQSEGELTIASTGKDSTTGRLVTHEYRVEGPVMILLTTTAVDIDDELLNRCIVLTVDEDREQTRAIHQMQRKAQTLEGLLARQSREEIRKLHQNAQRLLRPLLVANPYAEKLTFLDEKTRTRRDHMKYLTLIRAIALLHQYQRTKRSITHQKRNLEYIEVERSDVALANTLAHDVLGRSLDELPPQTRRLLDLIDEMVTDRCRELDMSRSDFRFTRRELREHTRWGHSQLALHLKRLEEMEYLIVHQGGRGQRIVYELLYDGQGGDGRPFLPCLIDLGEYDDNLPGRNSELPATFRAASGPLPGGFRGGENDEKPINGTRLGAVAAESVKNAHLEPRPKSYVLTDRSYAPAAPRTEP